MYLHKENRELFRDVILLTSHRLDMIWGHSLCECSP